MSDCLFCKIARGDIPATIAYEDEQVMAFHDIHPMAPQHLLIIPRAHLGGVGEAGPEHTALLGTLLLTARRLAEQGGFSQRGYRLVINQGSDAGQAVSHLHIHLLAGRPMGWTPA